MSAVKKCKVELRFASRAEQTVYDMIKEVIEFNMVQYVPFIFEYFCRSAALPVRDICCGGLNVNCACILIYILHTGIPFQNPFGWEPMNKPASFLDLQESARNYGFIMMTGDTQFQTSSILQNADAGRFTSDILPYLVVNPNFWYADIIRSLPSEESTNPIFTCCKLPRLFWPEWRLPETDEFDIVRFYDSELAARQAPEARKLLLCMRELVPDSPFYKDNFPLDMFKIVYYFLPFPYRDPFPRPGLNRIRDAPRMGLLKLKPIGDVKE